MSMPWLFHITDPQVAKALGPHLHEAGGIVVADPAYLTDTQRTDLLHTVGAPEGGELPVTIHAVDWTMTVEWDPENPDEVAADVHAVAERPAEFYDPGNLPEDMPAHVAEFLGLEPDED
ncbi:hypothetical protein [Glycomyces artemisiae]|uniref:Uncharacterized protein n=1 Tax=Glycomyces artemisiae TaxID=1076443 RepID=A0A2T0U6I8_9ACTN|nr:hypothetical protein [Glycomyces artemisiae]PRY53514.1 hypothetical protein B0I28_11713 [Glycomyces artemisiae]